VNRLIKLAVRSQLLLVLLFPFRNLNYVRREKLEGIWKKYDIAMVDISPDDIDFFIHHKSGSLPIISALVTEKFFRLNSGEKDSVVLAKFGQAGNRRNTAKHCASPTELIPSLFLNTLDTAQNLYFLQAIGRASCSLFH